MHRLLCAAFGAATLIASSSAAQDWYDAPRSLIPPTLPSGNDLQSLEAIGDIDNDGNLDLVGFGGSVLRPLLGDGEGDFVEAPVTPIGPITLMDDSRPRMGDVDGDNRADLVLLSSSGVLVHRGRSDGSLEAHLTLTTPTAPIDFALGDHNGDGALDIAIVHTGAVRWYEFAGGSTFAPGPDHAITTESFMHVNAGDFNGDGRADLILARSAALEVEVLLGSPGGPIPGPTFSVPADHNLTGVAAELDGAPGADLLVVGRIGVSKDLYVGAFLGDGNGGFAAQGPQTFNGIYEMFDPDHPRVGDLDGDGDDDLGGQSPLILGPGVAPPSGTRFENLGDGVFAAPKTIRLQHLSGFPGFGDLNNDGDLDLVHSGALLLGDGDFVEPAALAFFLPFAPFPFLDDYEEDGDLDLLSPRLSLQRNDGSGAFGPSEPLVPNAGPLSLDASLVFADLDGDGWRDWLAALIEDLGPFNPPNFFGMHLVSEKGDLKFDHAKLAAPVSTWIETLPAAHLNAARDLDLDGDLDLIVSSPSMTTQLWTNDGTGFFPDAPTELFDTWALDLADVDVDGDVDFLVLPSASTPQLLRQEPGLTFTSEALTGAGSLTETARFADVDDDGDLDILAASPGNPFVEGSIYVFEGSAGSFSSALKIDAAPGFSESLWTGDVDGDGLSDVVHVSRFLELSGYSFLSVSRRTSGLNFEPRRDWYSMTPRALGDVDGDGDLDAVGATLVRGRALSSQDGAGGIRQFGAGTEGAGGAVPILGSRGPFSSTSQVSELRLRRAAGGAFGALFVGTTEAALIDFIVPGLTGYVLDVFAPVYLFADGAPGSTGEGSYTLPVQSGPALAGHTFIHQVFLIDPASPFGVTASNGLEIQHGI